MRELSNGKRRCAVRGTVPYLVQQPLKYRQIFVRDAALPTAGLAGGGGGTGLKPEQPRAPCGKSSISAKGQVTGRPVLSRVKSLQGLDGEPIFQGMPVNFQRFFENIEVFTDRQIDSGFADILLQFFQ